MPLGIRRRQAGRLAPSAGVNTQKLWGLERTLIASPPSSPPNQPDGGELKCFQPKLPVARR